MRLPLLLAVLILAAGCGNREATVREAPPYRPAQPPASVRDRDVRQQAPLVAPVYAMPRAAVYLACVKASLAYFHRVDEQDAAAGRLAVHDLNAWYGDTNVVVTLSDVGDGRTRVEATADGARPRMVLEKYLAQLGVTMRGDEALREAEAAVAQPPVAADSGASATSRP